MPLSMLSGIDGLSKQIGNLGSLMADVNQSVSDDPLGMDAAPPKTTMFGGMPQIDNGSIPDNFGGMGLNLGGPPKLSTGDLQSFFAAPTATPGSFAPQQTPTGVNAGASGGTTGGADWAGVDQWDSQIQAASAKYGVPINLIKAVMKLESNGDPNSVGAPGVWGPMQVNSSAWGQGPWSYDAGANIDKGVSILADAYKNAGTWDGALIAYRGGWGSDGYTTGQQYLDTVHGNWDTLNNMGSGAGLSAPVLPGASFSSIWGGGNAPITQEFGWTDFARNSDYAHSGAYDYTADYTRDRQPMGHAGVDVGVGYGTNLFAPVSGTVVYAGGTQYYCDTMGQGCGVPGSGELMIQLANGDQLILGHMSNIKVGQTVQAGQLVGQSGGENGAHVHVEYRKWVGQGVTNSGYEVIDPRQALGGSFAGVAGGATSSPTNYGYGAQALDGGNLAGNLANFYASQRRP